MKHNLTTWTYTEMQVLFFILTVLLLWHPYSIENWTFSRAEIIIWYFYAYHLFLILFSSRIENGRLRYSRYDAPVLRHLILLSVMSYYVTSLVTHQDYMCSICTASVATVVCLGQNSLTKTITLQAGFKFSFFQTCCQHMTREPSLSYYLNHSS